MRLLGIDPGFRNLGWAVIEDDGGPLRCIAAGMIRTKKTTHKVPLWQDNQDRCEIISRDVLKLLEEHNINYLAVEAESWTRTSSDRVIGMARGILYGLAATNGYAVVQWHPKDVRTELIGKKNASKEALEEWLYENVSLSRHALSHIPKGQRNHAADAACIAVTEIRRGQLARIFRASEGRSVQ